MSEKGKYRGVPKEGWGSALTPTQVQVLKGLGDGFCIKELGDKLGLSLKAVEYHKTQICMKLNTTNIAMLVRIALAFGLSKL